MIAGRGETNTIGVKQHGLVMLNNTCKEAYVKSDVYRKVLSYLDILMGIHMKLDCKDRRYSGNYKKRGEKSETSPLFLLN